MAKAHKKGSGTTAKADLIHPRMCNMSEVNERKIGTVYSSNPKGWVFLFVTPKERYFGHLTQMGALDTIPAVGTKVSFTPAPPFKEGSLTCAHDVQLAGAEVIS
jgi:hypothetical protein